MIGVDFGVGPAVVKDTEMRRRNSFLPSMFWQYALGPLYLMTANSHTLPAGTLEYVTPDGSERKSLDAGQVVMAWCHARSPETGLYDGLHMSYSTKDDLASLPWLLFWFAAQKLREGMSGLCDSNPSVEEILVTSAAPIDFLCDGELLCAEQGQVLIRTSTDYVDVFVPQ